MVSIFKKDPAKQRARDASAASRRAERLSTADLADWADALLSEAGRQLTAWRRGRSDDALREFNLAVDALNAISGELEVRL